MAFTSSNTTLANEMRNSFKIDLNIVEYFKLSYIKGDDKNLQEVLIELRKKGCSQWESISLLVSEADFSLTDANRAILNSIAWNNELGNLGP